AKQLAASGSLVKPCAVVGFPLGAMKATCKAMEAVDLIKDGAQEIDFVAHLPNLLRGVPAGVEAAKTEFDQIVKAVRTAAGGVIVKVIIESAVLASGVSADQFEARVAAAAEAAREAGCDFIKTSTGFHPAGGATTQAVALMR